MKTFLKSLVAIGAVAAALLVAPAAHAQCGFSLPAAHLLDTTWTGLPEANLSSRFYILGNPAINNGTAVFLCASASDFVAGGFCQSSALLPDDGIVTANGNFVDPHTGYSGNILHVVDRSEERPEAVRRALPRLFESMEHDKKRGDAGVRWVLTPRVGHASVPRLISRRLVQAALLEAGARE